MGQTLTRQFIGLDLGQAQDPTALAGVEKEDRGEDTFYTLKVLKRADLGTPYPQVVERVRTLLTDGPYGQGNVKLMVDATGVGRPVVDMIRAAMADQVQAGTVQIVPVTITGGDRATWESWSWHVPKRDLMSTLVVLFQNQQLLIPEELPGKDALVRELLGIGRRISDAGRDSYGAWREGAHDDMVLALALACWGADQFDVRRSQSPARQSVHMRVPGDPVRPDWERPGLTPSEQLELRRRPYPGGRRSITERAGH